MYKQLDEVMDKIRNDLDLDEDEVVTDSQLIDIIHDGVKDMFAEMQKVGVENQYYMYKDTMSIVATQEEYSLPANISGTKFFRLIHNKAPNNFYPVKRLRGSKMFEEYHYLNQTPASNPDYKYMLLNQSPSAGIKIALVPTPQQNESNTVTRWFIRNPIKATADSDKVDVPGEFSQFVETFAKVECLKKDIGNPLLGEMKEELARIRKLMVETLADMTADGDNVMEMDVSSYEDQGADY